MNWRRGLFRLWLAGSIFWAGIAGWIVYDRHASAVARAATQKTCVEDRKRNSKLGNPFDCFDGRIEFDDLLPLQWRLREFAILVAPPVGGTFLLGAALLWIAAGFRRHPKSN